MSMINFKFYSVLKNEDAIPYLDDKIMVVADGLGGSGSHVHEIDKTIHQNMHDEIFNSAFFDFDFEKLNNDASDYVAYLEELIKPMTDEKDDTSALWASRIAIARLSYALSFGPFKDSNLSNENTRKDLVKYIYKGFLNIVKQFDLKNGEIVSQMLLPTTIVCIKYQEQDDKVLADVIWGGDSRAYVLLQDGLKAITKDDEDKTGAVMNLFHVGAMKNNFNYKHYEFSKPCSLLVVSDGVFDPFAPNDNLGVEATFFKSLKESNSFEELKSSLDVTYTDIHKDDTTMVFNSFGYNDFNDFKSKFEERINQIIDIYDKSVEYEQMLEMKNVSDDEGNHYVYSRIKDKYEKIKNILIDCIQNNKEDVVLSLDILNLINDEKTKLVSKKNSIVKQNKFEELNKYILNNPSLAVNNVIFECDNEVLLNNENYKNFIQISKKYIELKDIDEEYNKIKKEILLLKKKTHQKIYDQIRNARDEYDSIWNDHYDAEKFKNRYIKLNDYEVIDYCLRKCKVSVIKNILPRLDDANVIEALNNFLDKFQEYRNQLNFISNIQNEFINSWKILFEDLKHTIDYIKYVFNKDLLDKFNFFESENIPNVTLSIDDLDKVFNENKEQFSLSILKALGENYDKTSSIDSIFNAGRLSDFRAFYHWKHNPDSELIDFENVLNETLESYTKLLDKE